MTNTNELKKAIERKGLKNNYLAAQMGVSIGTFSRKLNNKVEFRLSEIKCLWKILELTGEEVNSIFFSQK